MCLSPSQALGPESPNAAIPQTPAQATVKETRFVLEIKAKLKTRRVTAGNSWWGVPPGSPNPDPISDQKKK